MVLGASCDAGGQDAPVAAVGQAATDALQPVATTRRRNKFKKKMSARRAISQHERRYAKVFKRIEKTERSKTVGRLQKCSVVLKSLILECKRVHDRHIQETEVKLQVMRNAMHEDLINREAKSARIAERTVVLTKTDAERASSCANAQAQGQIASLRNAILSAASRVDLSLACLKRESLNMPARSVGADAALAAVHSADFN